MAAGVPAVSYDCPSGPREIVEHDVNGLLVGTRVRGGARRAPCSRWRTDDDLRQRLGAGAVESARAWDADLLAARWERIFADALRRAARRPTWAGSRRRHCDARPGGCPAAVIGPDELGHATPAQARRQALAVATSTADEVSDEWFVVPPVAGAPPVVVVPTCGPGRVAARPRGRDATPAYLSLRDPGDHGWPERRGPVADLAESR